MFFGFVFLGTHLREVRGDGAKAFPELVECESRAMLLKREVKTMTVASYKGGG